MTGSVQDAVHRWLDETATAMGGSATQRRDVLLELETTIYDRLEENSSGPAPSAGDVELVLEAMGDPAEVANSFTPVQPLIPPYQTRSFLLNVAALFAVHMLLVIGATVAGDQFMLTPFRIAPISDPGNFLEVFARAAGALIFDVGLLLCVFALLPRLSRILRFPRTTLIVRPNVRRSIEAACFLGLVAIVVNVFRDDLFALYVQAPEGVRKVPLLGLGVTDNLLLLNAWIGASIVRELLYAQIGESRVTLGIDLVSNLLGLACLMRMLASRDLVDLDGAADVLGSVTETLGPLLNTSLMVLAVLTGALIGARLVYRAFRLVMVRRSY